MVRLSSYYDKLLREIDHLDDDLDDIFDDIDTDLDDTFDSIDADIDLQLERLDREIKEHRMGSMNRRTIRYRNGNVTVEYSNGLWSGVKIIIKFAILCLCMVVIFKFVSAIFDKTGPVPPPLNPTTTEEPVKAEPLKKL